MRAYLEIKRQRAKGSWPAQGPDTYVMVQIVPNGVKPLQNMNHKVAEKRGIILKYFGAGYGNRVTSPKSMLSVAINNGRDFCEKFNELMK